MRGKTSFFFLSLICACFQAGATPHTSQTESAITTHSDVKTVVSANMQLPDTKTRGELIQLLMELALANPHSVFSETWMKISSDSQLAAEPETYYQVYQLISQFRHYWYGLNWDGRERLNLSKFHPVFDTNHRQQYRQLSEQNQLGEAVVKLRPNAESYPQSRQALLNLLSQSRQGAWPVLPDGKIKPDEQNENLPIVRQILIRSGDLTENSLSSEQMTSIDYDNITLEAVKAFQARHGLEADGVIGRRTIQWLRLDPASQAVILARSILRSDFPRHQLGESYVLVNIPEFELRVWQGQQQVFASRVIVGRAERQTPILSSHISSVILNPAWHVPQSILKKDLVPKLMKDKEFLTKGQYELVDSEGMTVDPTTVVWDGTEEDFPYRLRQKPGDHNALGRYKFYIQNDDDIYLHSTSTPAYFKKDLRALSSGCVRVEEADDFARLLLKNSKWSDDKLAAFLKQEETKWLPVSSPLPVYTVYWRGWVDKEGKLQFRDDIYSFDSDLESIAKNPVLESLLKQNS